MDYPAAKAYMLNKLKNELDRRLFYHGVHHTLDVLEVTKELCIAEKVNSHDTLLLKTAALYHDCGFIINNQEHEKLGCGIARESLRLYNYTADQIEQICGMIMATKIPQSPQNFLEEILCDADLDYLGRDDFYSIGRTLFEELRAFKILDDEQKWNRIQVSFLESHHFFTTTNIKRRAERKQCYLDELREIVASYEKN